MGYNDCECERIASLLKDLKGISKVKVLRYHSFAGSRYEALEMENTMPRTETTEADVMRVTEKLRNYGINAEF